MTTSRAISLLAACASTLSAQGPELNCSYDHASPEVMHHGFASASDLGDIVEHPVDPDWLRQSSAALGLPAGAEIDAACHGLAMLFDDNVAGFEAAMCFAVDRFSDGAPGGAVADELAADGAAAADIFRIDWPGGTPAVTLAIPNPQLTQLPGAGGTDVDAIRFNMEFPVYYSVNPATAATLSVMLGTPVSPADILVTDAAFGIPKIYISHDRLGLVSSDDMDALVFGRGGVLYSLTKTSPTAVANPTVKGAGLFFNDANVWATAAEMELLPTDELNALEAEIFEPDYRHTPLLAGQTAHFRCDYQAPGSSAYFVASFGAPLPVPLCIPGLLCVDVLPEIVLGVAVVDGAGTARMSIDLAGDTPVLPLASQVIVVGPGGTISSTVEFSDAVVVPAM